jgi:hypothetical protein
MKRRNFVLSTLALLTGISPFTRLFAKNTVKGVVMISHPSESRGLAITVGSRVVILLVLLTTIIRHVWASEHFV